MPSVGKNFLPKKLQHLLNEDSPIKDLFPDPCPMCIEYKDQLKKLIKPPDDSAEEILEKYKEKLNEINKKYLTHLNEKHQLKDLPIKRLQTVVSNL
jgi:DnaJ-domain-containing protein 1